MCYMTSDGSFILLCVNMYNVIAIRAEGVCLWPTVGPSGQEERFDSARL